MAAKPEVPACGSEHRVSLTKGTQTHCKTDYFHSGNSPGRMPISSRPHRSRPSISQARLCLSAPQTASMDHKQLSSAINLSKLCCWSCLCHRGGKWAWFIFTTLISFNGRKTGTISIVHKNCSNVTSRYKVITYGSLSTLFPSLVLLMFILTPWQRLTLLQDESKAEGRVPPR